MFNSLIFLRVQIVEMEFWVFLWFCVHMHMYVNVCEPVWVRVINVDVCFALFSLLLKSTIELSVWIKTFCI